MSSRGFFVFSARKGRQPHKARPKENGHGQGNRKGSGRRRRNRHRDLRRNCRGGIRRRRPRGGVRRSGQERRQRGATPSELTKRQSPRRKRGRVSERMSGLFVSGKGGMMKTLEAFRHSSRRASAGLANSVRQ